MKVAELIAELEKQDQDAVVFRHGHPDGGGLDEIWEMDVLWAKKTDYYCSYAGDFDGVAEGTEGAVKGIRLW